MQGKKIGIMGGTFDPIHLGHIAAAENAFREFKLEEVVFVPCKIPVHKTGLQIAGVIHRCKMVELAIANCPQFLLSRIEIERDTPSFAVETLQTFSQMYGQASQLFFITGADAILEILSWKDSEHLADLCRFIAVTRPGHDLRQLRLNLTPELLSIVDILEIPNLSVSSTQIRERIRVNKSIRCLTHVNVANYIVENKLYREGY